MRPAFKKYLFFHLALLAFAVGFYFYGTLMSRLFPSGFYHCPLPESFFFDIDHVILSLHSLMYPSASKRKDRIAALFLFKNSLVKTLPDCREKETSGNYNAVYNYTIEIRFLQCTK